MKSAKSTNSLGPQQKQPQTTPITNQINAKTLNNGTKAGSTPTSPICRCRVMYLGSSVPHITKDGLQGIQEPLKELYPDKATLDSGNAGIDSWLSVWSNGILIENVDESGGEVKRFFKIDALHYCAAVKYVNPTSNQAAIGSYGTLANGQAASLPKFLPLDSPHAQQAGTSPPIFASILRRTSGIKVLECHAFICKREAAANALVRCCFHAYADTMYAKQIGADLNSITNDINNNRVDTRSNGGSKPNPTDTYSYGALAPNRRSKSIAALTNENGNSDTNGRNSNGYQIHQDRVDNERSILTRQKSLNSELLTNGHNLTLNGQIHPGDQLKRMQKLSKSMHHINQDPRMHSANQYADLVGNHYTYAANAPYFNISNGQPVPAQPLFYDPEAGRVPSYPPQNIIDANNGGTMRSIRSMAATSIASTLLRSKKHAKAMSVAQHSRDKTIPGFHQPIMSATTMGGPFVMPPIPPMFMQGLPGQPIMSGSQTMKLPSRPMMSMLGPPMNFEAMTPKELKKLLKKSAKQGLDPAKLSENGLPMPPMRPPFIPPQQCVMGPPDESGTMISRSALSDIYGTDMADTSSIRTMPLNRPGPASDLVDTSSIRPILMKPNPEFIKSKAGKKWLKQQKEFKKLLPPHLEGLPIVFGPPPVDGLEPAAIPENIGPYVRPHMPMMDPSYYYSNPHPFYAQPGRASTASTLLRYSPSSQLIHDGLGVPNLNGSYLNRSQPVYSAGSMMSQSPATQIQGDDDAYLMNDSRFTSDGRNYLQDSTKHGKRNHMVEQSVISLGDENDYDDDDQGHQQQENFYGGDDLDSHYVQPKGSQSNHRRPGMASERSPPKPHQRNQSYSNNYDQPIPPNDDQSSYSSGIYKREHINERAFSYSIRQEHKSGVRGSDIEHVSMADTRHYQNPHQLDYSNQHNGIHHNGNMHGSKSNQNSGNSHEAQLNDLASRFNGQMNIRLFDKSRVKPYM